MSKVPYSPEYGTPIEHAIVRALIENLGRAGYVPVKTWDGGEYVDTPDERTALDAVFSVDISTLHFAPKDDLEKWGNRGVALVAGNDCDIISDYHCGDPLFAAAVDMVCSNADKHVLTVHVTPKKS